MSNTIYALRCKENGRSYIGRTGSSMPERFKKHIYRLNHNSHASKAMQSDFNQYGKSSFEMIPIFKTDDYEYAKRLEKIVMLTLGGNKNTDCYNYQDPTFFGEIDWRKEKEKEDAEKFLKTRILNAVKLAEQTGFSKEQISEWKKDPFSIKAIDLLRLEQITGVRT